MNRVFLQLWEESERGWGVRPDGCSLHIDNIELDKYVDNIYKDRGDDIPNEYERTIGSSIETFIDDELFDKVISSKSIRISQSSLNNLILMNELIIKNP
jgi:hypothetical protein